MVLMLLLLAVTPRSNIEAFESVRSWSKLALVAAVTDLDGGTAVLALMADRDRNLELPV